MHFKTCSYLFSFHFRVRYDLRNCLLAWNTCLSVFSMVGLMRTLPELRDSIRNNGFYGSVCIKGNGSHQIAGKFIHKFGVELIFRPDFMKSYLFTMGDLAWFYFFRVLDVSFYYVESGRAWWHRFHRSQETASHISALVSKTFRNNFTVKHSKFKSISLVTSERKTVPLRHLTC